MRAARLLGLLAAAALLAGCLGIDDLDPTGPDAVAAADGDDVDCSRRALGEDAEAVFRTAYRVVDGELGEVCLGEADAALEAIWADLATMAPVALRRDLDVVSLFDAPDQGDDVTLAFVTAMDDAGTRFQMAFNAAASDEDPDELLLTTAHEFSHVFTATPDELDRVIQPEACRTYDNGEGCYRDGARMLDWIAAFWSDDQLADVGTADEPDVADGEERCAADAGFLGPYAATTPEEDFAESFSAFVLDVEPATPGQAERLAWFAEDPELAEVRDRARAAGLGPLPNTFATCG